LYESSEARKFNDGEIINFNALEKAKKLIDRTIPTDRHLLQLLNQAIFQQRPHALMDFSREGV
jgi:hypothetical protein